jgi:hypothetical protein
VLCLAAPQAPCTTASQSAGTQTRHAGLSI